MLILEVLRAGSGSSRQEVCFWRGRFIFYGFRYLNHPTGGPGKSWSSQMNRRGVKGDQLSSKIGFNHGLGVVSLYLVWEPGLPKSRAGHTGCRSSSSLTIEEE